MRRILPVACVAFAFTVGLSAQTTGSGSSPQSTQPSTSQGSTHKEHSAASSSGKSVTLTGCLKEGDTPGTYQLTNVDMSSMKSGKGSKSQSSSTATSGAGASSSEQSGLSSMGSSGTVNLVAGGSVDLKEHVGHRVQVTGNWGSGSAGTSGTSGTSGSSTESGSSSSSGKMSGNEKSLNVKSLKHISESCQ